MMDFVLDVTPKSDYVYVFHKNAVITEKLAERIIQESEKVCKEFQLNKVLIEAVNARREGGVFDFFSFASRLRETGSGIVKIAVVPGKPELVNKDSAFMETVAQNRGFLLKFFVDKNDALDWLQA